MEKNYFFEYLMEFLFDCDPTIGDVSFMISGYKKIPDFTVTLTINEFTGKEKFYHNFGENKNFKIYIESREIRLFKWNLWVLNGSAGRLSIESNTPLEKLKTRLLTAKNIKTISLIISENLYVSNILITQNV